MGKAVDLADTLTDSVQLKSPLIISEKRSVGVTNLDCPKFPP